MVRYKGKQRPPSASNVDWHVKYLRVHGLIERVGTSRMYQLTHKGEKALMTGKFIGFDMHIKKLAPLEKRGELPQWNEPMAIAASAKVADHPSSRSIIAEGTVTVGKQWPTIVDLGKGIEVMLRKKPISAAKIGDEVKISVVVRK